MAINFAVIATALETIKGAIALGKNVKPLLDKLLAAFKKPEEEITDEDMAAIRRENDALRQELHADLPPAEPGERTD